MDDQGAILYLDEFAEARSDVIVILHALTDHRRQLFLDRHDEFLQAPSSFMMAVSFNPGYQHGLRSLKPSTRQRFVGMTFGYPEPDVERAIIEGETGIEIGMAKRLVHLAGRLRKLDELGLAESASTRLLVDAATLIGAGMAPRRACHAAIVEPLSDDPEILQALREAVDLLI